MIKRLLPIMLLHLLIASAYGQTTHQFARMNSGPLFHYEHIINIYTDSLNFWKEGDPLPAFLSDPTIDLYRLHIFKDLDDQVWHYSFRKIVLDRTVNVDVLTAILQSEDKRLDALYDPKKHFIYSYFVPAEEASPGPDILYMDFSTRQLVIKRLNDVRKKADE